ncbi:enoyl-CoA hydratase/isomerase family protein [Haladaptatus sp. GCM10025707]|uniref:enoyl-CoA hydratase/isomerase family protein n=1 Tax=unclassified Haladaptatus TaxID=2622732 RepID=UPI0023E77435|nr:MULTISPECIES: enoyl-CoA hydratase/isomerase family protein [unclassified Haladaptatus]
MISTTDTGALRVVTLDRPAQRNALTVDGLEALSEAVTETDATVVYIHGAGSAFSAGADLSEVRDLDGQAAKEFAELGQRVAADIENAEAVTVAGIDGAARGGGVELALACDVRVATQRATFAEPGVVFGLFGAWGGTVRLPKIVGQGEALDIGLTGRIIDADEALRVGLISQITENPQAVAERIASNNPAALRVVKERIRDEATTDAQERAEAEAFADLVETAVDFDSHRKG